MSNDVYKGQVLGNVLLKEILGQGAMSCVYRGHQSSLKRDVAVKILPKHPGTAQVSGTLFRQEGEVVAGLCHPNIIPIFEMGETDTCFYQVMQLVDGESLETCILHLIGGRKVPCGCASLAVRLDLFCQVLDALEYAHSEGVVHQDVKPSNILVSFKGRRPLVADFGIASTLLSEVPPDMIYGSPVYIAPERLRGEPADRRCDVYSAAMVLYKLVAGLIPLATRDRNVLLRAKVHDPAALFYCRPRRASPYIDARLEAILLRALESDPLRRYQSCGEFQEELAAYARARHQGERSSSSSRVLDRVA